MPSHPPPPRAWRLAPSRAHAQDVVSKLVVHGAASDQTVLVPYSPGLEYVVVATEGEVRSVGTEGDFRVEPMGALATVWARARLALFFKKKKYLRFKEFSLYSRGPKPERKRFTTFNQHMFNTGVALDGDLVTSHPELLQGWPEIEPPAVRPLGPVKTAIVAHVYYEETWPDFAEVLKRLAVPFDLIVTTVPGRERLAEAVKREFPWGEVVVSENRGRDVRPFLALLEQGRLDRYAYVCKLHGKKSSDGGRMAYLGSLWRRRLLFDLLAGPDIAAKIIAALERDPGIGMIGPHAFRLPSAIYSEKLAWGSGNRETILALARRMGVPAERFRLDFFGGTMFWVRPEALRPLRDLKLPADFLEEKGLLDGGLEHAVERLFATSTVAAGYRLADSDGISVLNAASAESSG